ncbi:MAG: SMP-30/gluconolactonase/LRE family protein [Actinobacteria bacterium]|nr:SMP-30/gluconolactonase/LRE family protein [Actinomycetota bacterium]
MSVSLKNVEVAAEVRCQLGEGPVWDTDRSRLYFVDIFGKKVFSFDPTSKTFDSFSTELSPGAVIPTNEANLLLAMNDGLYISDYRGQNLKKLLEIEADIQSNRMNDAKCDALGRLLGGTMGDGNSPTGSFYFISSGKYTRLRKGVTVSNGIAWSLDNKIIYYIDSALKSVLSSNYSLDSPTEVNFETFVEFPSSYGIPDGMCSDREGGIWISFFGGAAVRRFSKNGQLTHAIEMPVNQITSCAFQSGTSNLFITTASLDIEGKAISPLAGNLFCIDVGMEGVPVSKFDLTGFKA